MRVSLLADAAGGQQEEAIWSGDELAFCCARERKDEERR